MVWANASGQSMPEFVCVPGTDPSGGVGRDVGALHQESRFVPSLRSTGKSLLHDEASVRPSRRVATIARHDGIDEVLAPIDVSAAASRAPTKEAMSATTEGQITLEDADVFLRALTMTSPCPMFSRGIGAYGRFGVPLSYDGRARGDLKADRSASSSLVQPSPTPAK